jgi:uncharacterized OsmC-like protein
VEGGVGSSLKSDQKRTLHVRGEVTVQDDGLLQARVQLLKPIGSTFRFLCDYQQENSPKASTPSPLAYLAAGVGFCFMTQVGRYATIVKQDLKAYRIVQDTVFKMNARVATAEPVNTHLFIETSEPVKAAQKTLSMSEQTCFLHAAMRTVCPSIITAKLVGSASQARTS